MRKVRLKKEAMLLFLGIGFILFGCTKTKRVTIDSNPGGARIFINGEESGITPLTKSFVFEGNKDYQVVVKQEGYKDGKIAVSSASGQTDYSINLEKEETTSVELVTFEPVSTDKGVATLSIIRKPTTAYLETIERSPNVESVTRVTNNEDKALQIGAPVLSPTEDVLCYRTFVEEGKGSSYSNIWKQTIGSAGKTLVTFGKWLDLFPCFTPDGKNLVFSSNRNSSNPVIWRIRIGSGGGIAKITSSLAADTAPSVSPDGKLIVYSSKPPEADDPQIWTIDGSLSTQLREGESPQFSPDGKKILFIRKTKDTKKEQLWIMNIDGGEETQLSQNNDYDVIDPRWSPDGKWIVFASDEGLDSRKVRNFDIWIIAADGSQKTQLTTNGSMDDSPCWDREGKFIYFRSNRGGAWNIWRFKPSQMMVNVP